MDLEATTRGVLPHIVQPLHLTLLSMPGGALLNLEKLALDGTHPGHEAIEFR
jgi:hypothetical protein